MSDQEKPALFSKEMKEWQAELAKRHETRKLLEVFQRRPFEELNEKEKDLLLKKIAVMLGVIPDTD